MKFPHSLAHLRTVYENRSEPENIRLLTRMYWRILALLTIVGILAAFAYGMLELQGVLSDISSKQTASAVTQSVAGLNALQIEALLQQFQARQSEFEALSAHASTTVADPYQ